MRVTISKIKLTRSQTKEVTAIEFILNKNELLASENASKVVVCVLTRLIDGKPLL